MRILHLSTIPHKLTGATYMRVWLRWRLRRHAPWMVSAAVALVAVAVADPRVAISAAMLGAVLLPMAAIIACHRMMGLYNFSEALSTRSVTVDDDSTVTVTPVADDADTQPDAPQPAPKVHRLTGATEAAGHLLLMLDGDTAPLMVPRQAITNIEISPETFT